MIKRLRGFLQVVLLALLLHGLTFTGSYAQQYGNEWIKPGNTYYKFKIAKEGIYRINKAQLDAIGMSGVTGNQFAVFREGVEVPVYTSVTGAFGGNDFIEFYATKADGKIDSDLYADPSYQPNKDLNLISDTAYYFLTYDNTTHQRLQLVANAIPSPAPAAAPYCWTVAWPTENIRSDFNAGWNYIGDDYFYSADFDLGEGWAYPGRVPMHNLNVPVSQVYNGNGLNSTVSFSLAGHSIAATPHLFKVKVNSTVIFDTTVSGFNMVKRSLNIASGMLSSPSSVFTFSDTVNKYVMELSVRYPHTYNFNGNLSNVAGFQVPAADRYLEITGFNGGGQAPRLIDRSNNKIYTGTLDAGTVKFYLDNSFSERNMLLSNTASLTPVTEFKPVVFRDYSNSANQGNYIILSHKSYINATPNYLNDYKTYRSSTNGGAYSPVIVDVTELYDQFGYGFEYHPMSIRKFIKYANDNWAPKPAYLFIVGKGVVYNAYNTYLQNSGLYNYPLVPTWGDPGSDNLFSSFNNDNKPTLATGRFSAWNNTEIGNYLAKVKLYEAALRPASVPTVATELWKKRGLNVAGSSNLGLQIGLLGSLNDCKRIYEDTLVGGIVTTIAKSTTDPVDQGNSNIVDSLVNKGLGNLTFYGHASSTGFDFNLNTPNNYHSSPRFMTFFAYGCNVGQIFALSSSRTISESYLLSENGGSIMMIAGDNTGYTSVLQAYMQGLTQSIAFRDYGKTLGEQYRKNIEFLQNNYGGAFVDIHTQCLVYQGDPALSVFNPEKKDYAIEENSLSTNPVNVTTELDSFTLKAVVYNLGKAEQDRVLVRIQHTRQGSSAVVYTDSLRVPNLYNSDTVYFKVPINPNLDIGLNNYTVKVDANDEYDEISEQNNAATLQLFIYSENLVPVYPREFAIVHDQNTVLKASTLNAFARNMRYKLEIDTTENFNSSLKQTTQVTSSGGVIKWKPTLNYIDSVVYYWRAAPDTLINGKNSWASSSFIYLANGSDGWNQSHYFQYLKDGFSGMKLLESNRKFRFNPLVNTLKIENKVIYPTANDYSNVRQSLNDLPLDTWGCAFEGSVQILVIDSVSGQPWKNTYSGLYGSYPGCSPNDTTRPRYQYEFPTDTRESRNKARDFIAMVPDGNYIMIKNLIYGYSSWNAQTATQWEADELVNGAGNSLYHSIKNLGFGKVDSFRDAKKVFAFFRKKGDNSYPVFQEVTVDTVSKITMDNITFLSYPDTGLLNSTIVGPALEWKELKWRSSATDNAPTLDSPYVEVFGLDQFNAETLLYSGFSRDTSLSYIPAAQYRRLKLNWYSVDNIARTSPYLDYWRVLYTPVPEAALNANAHFEFADSLTAGQQAKLRIAIENLTPIPMDSMLVRYKIIDANNNTHVLGDKRYKKLIGNDTLIADFEFDPLGYAGKNFLFIEANPDNAQPEAYHPNNLGYLTLQMTTDQKNPVLDVTFDGIHILDKDIVSAKPLIKVLMRDENKYMPLNDTALMRVQLVSPGSSSPVNVPIDGTICKFFPATASGAGTKNEARIEFKPELLEDGIYKLMVSGKDKSGNIAGSAPLYEINFTIENKPSITNVLNYPNPFSTATQFIFTMTGSEVPSQFKIQIITITGKVVREIKKYELGNLHIGRNITDYRWDGKDEYGQTLGNGVYLYRVITSIRGEGIEQRKNAAVDKYFKNGYGKLYIMR
jgi:hypothetical protein